MKKDHRTLVQALVASLLRSARWAGPVNVKHRRRVVAGEGTRRIGPSKAQAIVEYARRTGRFAA